MHQFFMMAVYLCTLAEPCAPQPVMGKLLWTISECRSAESEVHKNQVPFPTMQWVTTCTPQWKWLRPAPVKLYYQPTSGLCSDAIHLPWPSRVDGLCHTEDAK